VKIILIRFHIFDFRGTPTGIDIRKVGSGNIGATNVLRIAGLSTAIISGIFDLSKGLLPVLIGRYIFHFDIYTIF